MTSEETQALIDQIDVCQKQARILFQMLKIHRATAKEAIVDKLFPEVDDAILKAIRDSANDARFVENAKLKMYQNKFRDDVRKALASSVESSLEKLGS